MGHFEGPNETYDTARNLTLQHQLHNLDWKEGDNMHDHITKVRVVRDQWASIGHSVDSTQLALMVLYRLPKSYRGFVATITTSERS